MFEKRIMKNILDQYRKDPIKNDVLSYLSSINEDLWILEEDILGTIAHVVMLGEQNIISDVELKDILRELRNIFISIKNGTFKVDFDYEDIHPFIENLVIEKIGINIGGKIHSGRSRNDQVACDIRLKVRKEILSTSSLLLELIGALLKLAENSITYYCPLYTHLQRAQLGIFSQIPLNYCYQLSRMLERLINCFQEINKNPLGAGAIGGTSLPINRKLVSNLLGFDGEIVNSVDAISSRDHIIFTLMILTLIANCFTRIAEDFIIYSSKEFRFVEIDDSYASVSSAMPQKKNPDTLELIKGKMGRIYGGLTQILFVSKGVFTGYSRDFQESKIPLKESFDTIKSSIQIMTGIFETIKLNPTNMRNCADQSNVLALDLAEYLVLNTDLSFRESHNLIGALVKKFNDINEIFNINNLKTTCVEIFNKTINISQKEINFLKNFDYVLNQRKSIGAPNAININSSLKEIKEIKKNYEEKIQRLQSKIEKSEKNLLKEVDRIIS
jgi:argininosuccinate lyase